LRSFGLKAEVKGKGIKENNHLCPSPKTKQKVETDEVCGMGAMRKAYFGLETSRDENTCETPTKMGG
jgi:hypothetical protein